MITMMKKTMIITLESQQEIDLFTSLIGSLTEELCEKFGLRGDWVSSCYTRFADESLKPRVLVSASIDTSE